MNRLRDGTDAYESTQPSRTFLEVGVLGIHDMFGDLSSASLQTLRGANVPLKREKSNGKIQEKHRSTSMEFSVVSTCHVHCYTLNKWDVQRKLAMDSESFDKVRVLRSFECKLRNSLYIFIQHLIRSMTSLLNIRQLVPRKTTLT